MEEKLGLPSPDFKAEIPPNIRNEIEKEVQKDIAPILEEDPETAEFYKEAMTDYRERVYGVLSWVKEKFNPSSVLYPASGFDRMPKLVFEENMVVHTSLEEYKTGDRKYFEDLGEGKRVVADNVALPFPDSKFQAIVLLGLPYEFVAPQRNELVRVLDRGGVIVLARNILTDYDKEEVESWQNFAQDLPFEKLIVPDQFQGGDLETEFLVFKKQKK